MSKRVDWNKAAEPQSMRCRPKHGEKYVARAQSLQETFARSSLRAKSARSMI